MKSGSPRRRVHYPTKRSLLVPLLLFVQDEVGYLSDEAIAEMAKRVELTELEVRNVISYYSMLRTKPMGKYNVQVCTNICCMQRGGEEIFEHCKKTLGVGHKQTTPDGLFSLEEVECIGACSWAPAIQVNYDFHENLTPEKVDAVIRVVSQAREAVGRSEKRRMADLVSHPDEVKVISSRWGKGATNIDRYLELDGYKAVQKALTMTPDAIINEVKTSNLRGRGGAGFPTGMKWSFVPKESAKPKYILCNGDEIEPGTCKDRLIFEHDPHSRDRRRDHRRAGGRREDGLHLPARRISIPVDHHAEGDCRCVCEGLPREEHLRQRQDFDVYWHGGAGAYEVGEESALMESLEGKRGIPRIRPPFPAVVGLWGGPTVINNAETLAAVPRSC